MQESWDRGVSDGLGAVGKAQQALPQSGNAVVLDPTHPIRDRIKQLSEAWIESGRSGDWLISGKAFFLAYCWALKHKVASTETSDHDAEVAAFMDASLGSIGGPDGWSKMLADPTFCVVCNQRFRLDNISICTGCMNYFCGWQTERCVCRCGEMVG